MQSHRKTVVVTGATGAIGKVICRELAEKGHHIIMLDLSSKELNLNHLKSALREEYSVTVEYFTLDLTRYDNIVDTAHQINARHSIDVLINNAGVNTIVSSFQLKEEEWDQICNVNLKGTFFLTQKIAEGMVASDRGGTIVNIASQHGTVGNENRAAYCASKGGLINLTKALAVEWAKFNIRVNCVSPTYVHTENNKSMYANAVFQSHTLTKIPLRKYAGPLDVARAVMFLAGEDSPMITGENLVVDGGYTAM